MTEAFVIQKRKKALIYTIGICTAILLLFILISWKVQPIVVPVVQDLIEINLGNDNEGLGEEQPLIKGEMSPSTEIPTPQPTVAQQDIPDEVMPHENAAPEAAPVRKPEKKIPKVKTPTKSQTIPQPVVKPLPKAKSVYNGPGSGKGNGAQTDNGYTMQGNKAGGNGDAGSPSGNADSYGNTPGGKIGGPKVIRGNRSIRSFPSFTGDLSRATIYADIKVNPAGGGSLVRLVKPSTSFSSSYSTAISGYLRNIKFNADDAESIVTVRFNFEVQ